MADAREHLLGRIQEQREEFERRYAAYVGPQQIHRDLVVEAWSDLEELLTWHDTLARADRLLGD